MNLKNAVPYLEFVELTPKLAKTWLDTVERPRPLSKMNLVKLENDINEGRYNKPNNDAICHDKNYHMMNGQHRCNAVLNTGKSIPVIVFYGLEPEDFDILDGGKKRSGGDVLSILNVQYYNETAAALKSLYCYLKGHSFKVHNFHLTPHQIVEMYNEHEEIINGHKFFIKLSKKANFISRSSFLFVYYVANREAVEFAEEFFTSLVTGVGFESEYHPAYLLRNILIRDAAAKINKMPGYIKLYLLVKAWNAYYNNKEIHVLRFRGEKYLEIEGDVLEHN